MRHLAARSLAPQPAQIKRNVSNVQHLDAPTKGLSLLGKTGQGDQQTATILTNWTVHEDHIKIRPGTHLLHQHPTGIVQMMPYLNNPEHLLAGLGINPPGVADYRVVKATTGELVRGGFASSDWHWTMFANLSQQKFMVMVNGKDGVWSYNGDASDPGGPIAGCSLANTNPPPAVMTVPVGEIGKFTQGMRILISGATGQMSHANGWQTVGTITGNTFTVLGLDTSPASAAQTVTVDPQTGMVKEDVRPPTGASYCNVNDFQIVLAHINRLYFADSAHLAIYYLPLQSKGGPTTGDPNTDPGLLKVLPMNAIFKRGGTIRAMISWAVEGGEGMSARLCVFTTHGEVAIYSGIDPAASNFQLLGVFKHDAPMSRYCVQNYGGDVWSLTGTGLAPLSVLMVAGTEKLTKAEKGTISFFREIAARYRDSPGWFLLPDYSTGRMICNMPLGSSDRYMQMVRFMPDPIWAQLDGLKSRNWAWIDGNLFCGSDSGALYEVSDKLTSDNGDAISAEYRGAWSAFKTPGVKHFKMVRVYGRTNGLTVRPFVDFDVNFFPSRKELNQPEPIQRAPGTMWSVKGSHVGDPGFTPWSGNRGTAPLTLWSGSKRVAMVWAGVGRLGAVGAPHLRVSVLDAEYEISGFDVVFETGSV